MNPQSSPTSFSHPRHWPLRPDRHINISMDSWSPPTPSGPTDDTTTPEPPDWAGCAVGPVGRPRAQRGMTLVEILVVVALIGIAALIAVTNLLTIQKRFQLENGVREFTAFLNEVPNYAKQQNAPVFLVWDATARSFSVATDATATNVLDTIVIPTELTITGPGAAVLRCDVIGRTFVGTSTVMMTSLQTVLMTHSNTPEASAPSYILSLSPLWAVTVTRA